ncbi:hypothetical protein ACFZB9_24830 [Kitasatospora sp. NPDC008050]|uniref:hypothetical protein n=1 Tax=Kitasatospora sp. NPDC008050 TaxID=3364021 RepID=UPI0036EB786C
MLVPADGTLARLVRLALPGAEPAGHEAPTVVVETTGTGAGILDALAAARPGGCVLLAVRPLHRTTSLPSYHAIHRPELRVLPVPWADPTTKAPEQLIARALAQLAPARLR